MKLFDPSGNSIFTTTLQNDGSGGVDGLSGDYLTVTLDSAAMTALSNLGDGNHALRVEMADAFNNGASTGITIEQASTLPTITVTDTILGENSAGSITDDSVQITGTSTDANYILVTVADDGGGSTANTATYKVAPDSTGTWTLDLDTATPQGGTAITTDNGDTFSITASAHGDLNNTAATATANDYIVDLFAPTLMPQYDPLDYYEFDDWPLTNYYNLGVTFGDVNGDGNLDMAVATDGGAGNDAGVFYGKNGGTFDGQAQVAMTTTDYTRQTHLVDLDGNGYDDMIVVDRRKIYTVLANNDGSGLQSTYTQIYDSGNSSGFNELYGVKINTGDFNGDGHIDFSFTNQSTNNSWGGAYVFMGDGSGTSFDEQTRPINSSQFYMYEPSAMGDVDNDGDADMIYFRRNRSSPYQNYLTIHDGQNSTSTPLITNQTQTIDIDYDNGVMSDVQLADMNNDGWQDIAFIHNSSEYLNIYFNTQSATGNSYSTSSSYVTSLDLNTLLGRSDIGHVHDFRLEDLDADGDIDIMLSYGVGTSYIRYMSILTQNDDGSFSEYSTMEYDEYARDLGTNKAVGQSVQQEDFNGDGILDSFLFDRYRADYGTTAGYYHDPRIHWGRIATIADGGSAINQDQEILSLNLGDSTAVGDVLTITYNGATIGTATASATDVSNGSMDITLNNVENLYNGGRNLLTFTISDALGGTNTYMQSIEVATNSAASNSYILHFDGEADTLTSFTAGDGAGGDKMNISQLLTDAGYTGAIDWTTLESGGYISRADDGSGNTIISVDKDGTAGTTHDLQHIVTLNNTTAANLDDDDIE